MRADSHVCRLDLALGTDCDTEELSIEKGNTELLGLIRHRDTGPDSKRTMAAVCMEGKRVAMRMRDRAAYMRLLIGSETGPGHNGPVERKGHQRKEEC